MSRKWITFGVLLLLLGNIIPARADGLMFFEGVYRQPSMSKINVDIKDKIATTTIEQTFKNTLAKQVSATYVAPVPPGATVTGFAELIDGQWIEAKTESKADAKAQFDDAAKKGQDAAIVAGDLQKAAPNQDPKTTLMTQIVLPPNSDRSVRLIYTEILNGAAGVVRYNYPLSSTKWTDENVGDLSIAVKVTEKDEIRAVYSPSHKDLETSRASKTETSAFYRAQNVNPAQDFELVYTQSSEQFGLNLASYRPADEQDGYFMLIAAPQLEVDKTQIVQKDFVFVLDRSGSMEGEKFNQAKTALNKMLDSLNEGDRFNIVIFDNAVSTYQGSLQGINQRDAAKGWVNALKTGGGTNISGGLQNAFKTVDESSNRPHIIVFLTDGQPTAGEVVISKILGIARESIRPQSRLYTIGIGADVNEPLLTQLAAENRGAALYVTRMDQIEQQLGKFYAGIGAPVLVDLALDFGKMDVYDMYPAKIPDMFLGGQVVVAGRYRGGGVENVKLTGRINGAVHTSTFENIKFVAAGEDASSYAYVPRLWAQRKVDGLVRDMQINGFQQQNMDLVKSLGLKYNIVTPYTSFVVKAPVKNNGNNTNPNGNAPLPNTGLPFLYQDDYRTVNTALMVLGGAFMALGLAGMVLRRVRRA